MISAANVGLAARGVDVQAHRHGGDRGARRGLARRRPGGHRRDRVPAGPVRQRVRDLARHRQAAVGVPGQRARRRAGRGRTGWRSPDGVVYGDTSTSVFALNAATGKVVWNDTSLLSSGQGDVRDPADGGRRAGVPGQRLRVGAGRRGAARARRGDRREAVEVQHGGRRPGGRASRRSASAPAAPGRRRWSGRTGRSRSGSGTRTSRSARRSATRRGSSTPTARSTSTRPPASCAGTTRRCRTTSRTTTCSSRRSRPTVGGVPAVIGGGKMGDVYAMNAATGALLWKTPVGVAQRHRRRLAAAARAQAHHQAAVHVSSRARSAAC